MALIISLNDETTRKIAAQLEMLGHINKVKYTEQGNKKMLNTRSYTLESR